MFPLVRQVRAATDHAVNATARLAGAEPLGIRQYRSKLRRARRAADQGDRLRQRFQACADRRQRGQGDQDHVSERRDARLHRAVAAVGKFAAEFLFPLHHGLRHPAPLRRRSRQARFHGDAGQSVTPAQTCSAGAHGVTARSRTSARRSSMSSPEPPTRSPIEAIHDGMLPIADTTCSVAPTTWSLISSVLVSKRLRLGRGIGRGRGADRLIGLRDQERRVRRQNRSSRHLGPRRDRLGYDRRRDGARRRKRGCSRRRRFGRRQAGVRGRRHLPRRGGSSRPPSGP